MQIGWYKHRKRFNWGITWLNSVTWKSEMGKEGNGKIFWVGYWVIFIPDKLENNK